MARFDWQRFCERHKITYVTGGPNTARGNISIQCPFCGAADQSQHMGLKLDPRDPQWGCFRNATHRGRDPSRLVAMLLHVSHAAAQQVVADSAPPVDSLDETLHRLRNLSGHAQDAAGSVVRALPMPDSFQPLRRAEPYAERFFEYLIDRHFGRADVEDVAERYQLHFALTGPQAWRLIFPVRSERGELIGWTGRALTKNPRIRYLAREEMGKDWLLVSPRTEPARVLIASEGPVDFLKLDYYGRPFGVEAVATMGTAITPAQFIQLARKARNYERVYSLFDPEAFAQNIRLASELAGFNSFTKFYHLREAEDPGALTATTAKELCRLLSV